MKRYTTPRKPISYQSLKGVIVQADLADEEFICALLLTSSNLEKLNYIYDMDTLVAVAAKKKLTMTANCSERSLKMIGQD